MADDLIPLFYVRVSWGEGAHTTSVTRYLPMAAVRRARDPWRRVVGNQVNRLANELYGAGVWSNRGLRRRLRWTAGIERGVWGG